MKLENDVINKIRTSIDIVSVISSYLPLTSKGKNYFGVCPFHDDHSPSMSVSQEKQIYTCFSCGATGNVFKFIQDYENISFIEALKKCADIAGIPLDVKLNSQVPVNSKYASLYDIYNISQMFYQNNINSSEGLRAKAYLYNRDITDSLIKEFEIGLSLNDSSLLTKLLKSKKFNDKDLLRSGLVTDTGYDLHDIYRNRIMFPLHDTNGKLIGYNGRAYNGEDTNKYVNSKETEIFKKREVLYNYHRAKDEARIKKSIIIMEGPMDVIRAYTIGVKNVVASLGTAFGPEQALLIRKLASSVILCFDGDQAGLKATNQAIDELERVGITPSIVRLPDNADPDEYIRTHGKEAFNEKINNAMNIIEFKEMLLKTNVDFNNTLELANYVNAMIKEISQIDDEVLREVSINKLAEESRLDKNMLKDKILGLSPKTVPVENIIKPNIKLNKYDKSERNLVYYMLHSTNVIKMYDKKITHINIDRYRHLAFQISSFYKQYGYMDIADLLTSLRDDPDSIKTIGELESLNLKEKYDIDEIEDYLENIKKRNELDEINRYKSELARTDELQTKLELAKKVIAYKMRSEENDR